MGPQARGHAAGGEQASEDSSVFIAAPHCSSYCLSSNSWQILHYGKLYSYFSIFHNVITTEIKCTINPLCLNHPGNNSSLENPWKNWKNSMKCVPVAKMVGDRCAREWLSRFQRGVVLKTS